MLLFFLFSLLLVGVKPGVSKWLHGCLAAGQGQPTTFIFSHHRDEPKTGLKLNDFQKKKTKLNTNLKQF